MPKEQPLADTRQKRSLDKLLLTADLAGTFLFAIEGAQAGIQRDLDFFGLLVLAFVTALGGGIIRDLLIGSVPPNSVRDWRYPAISFLGGLIVFFFYAFVQGIPARFLLVLDAAGLALFAVSGAGKALRFGISPFLAVLMGGLTGVGGGTLRDIFLAQIPAVLRTDIYAVAALFGATVMVLGMRLKNAPVTMALAGGFACFILRVVSVWNNWNLPHVAVR